MGITVFKAEPSAVAVRTFLGRTIATSGAKPKHLICDKGSQFWPCKDFKDWCDRKNIKPRFGAVGEHGSIAIVEQFILTMKQVLALLTRIPLRCESFRNELSMISQWYNEHRPHDSLGGKTPDEVYDDCFPANRKPRIEPRAVVVQRVSVARLGGSRQARNHPNEPPKVAGPLHPIVVVVTLVFMR
jgi:integrase-like protein